MGLKLLLGLKLLINLINILRELLRNSLTSYPSLHALLLTLEFLILLLLLYFQPAQRLRGLGGVVVIDAAIGAHGRGSRPVHYLTVAATLDKSLTSHCL